MMRINAILVVQWSVVLRLNLLDRFFCLQDLLRAEMAVCSSSDPPTSLNGRVHVVMLCCTQDARSVGPCISIHAITGTADRLRRQWIAKSAPLKSDAQSERAEGIIHKWDPTISQRFTSATIPEPAIEGSPECLVGEQWHSRHGRPTSKCVRTQGLRIDWKREAGGVRCPRLARRRWDA